MNFPQNAAFCDTSFFFASLCHGESNYEKAGDVLARCVEEKIALHTTVIVTLEPGGTVIGRKMRRVLLDSGNKALTPLAELMLYAADRAQHVEEIIKPALKAGKWVICDRFSDATVVYQGAARGQDEKLIRLLNHVVTDGIRPHLTFLLDCPVETGLGRALGRNMKGQDRFEKEALSFHRKVRKGYLDLARKNRKRFVVLDATAGRKEIEAEILRPCSPSRCRWR